jgi:hypothetical protein
MRSARVDDDVRAVIFGHSISGDLEFRYDYVNEPDLLDATDRTEICLERVSETGNKSIDIFVRPIFFSFLRICSVGVRFLGDL